MYTLIVELYVTGFSPLKQSILVMMVPMAVIVMQTASISDLERIIVHVQQVIKGMELCAQVRFLLLLLVQGLLGLINCGPPLLFGGRGGKHHKVLPPSSTP